MHASPVRNRVNARIRDPIKEMQTAMNCKKTLATFVKLLNSEKYF